MRIFRSVRLILVLVLTIPPGIAAQVTLRGTVTDSMTYETLVGANVYLPGTAFGGVTDREGKYSISHIPAGVHTVRSSYIGYRGKDLSMDITGPEFIAATRRIFDGIVNHLVSVNKDGFVDLHHTSAGAGPGGKAYRDGSYAYYIGVPQRTNDMKGYAPFLLAAIELERGAAVPGGKAQKENIRR